MDTDDTTRARLLRVAGEMFAEEGYAAVSVRDLAERAGLTSGAIYGNFGSKAGLLLALIDAGILDELISGFIDEPPEGVASVADIDEFVFSNYPARSHLRALLIEGAVAARGDSELRSRLGEDQAAKIDEWAGIYGLWQERGEIDTDLDVRALLVALWAIELGVGVLESLDVDLPTPDRLGAVVGRFMQGVAPTVGRP